MFIGLTEEQELLRETMRRLADTTATSGPDDIASDDRLDTQWQRLVEVGVPAFRAPATCGLEASGVETALAIEELGRRLSALPVLGQAVLTTELLYAAGAEKEVDLIAEGALRMAPVLRDDLSGFADSEDRGVVLDSAGATHALLALSDGKRRRLVYAAIDTASGREGLDLTRSISPISASGLGATTSVGDPIDARRWDSVMAMALTAVAADLIGVMTGALEDAAGYAGERVQFGVKIGTFQAVQHILADSLVRLEGLVVVCGTRRGRSTTSPRRGLAGGAHGQGLRVGRRSRRRRGGHASPGWHLHHLGACRACAPSPNTVEPQAVR